MKKATAVALSALLAVLALTAADCETRSGDGTGAGTTQQR